MTPAPSATPLARLALWVLLAVPGAAAADGARRESPVEMRRIVAQAICLAQAYPQDAIARDSGAVVAVYQGQLGKAVSVQSLEAVRSLAAKARPAAPTPVGNHNLAIARCVLFAEQADVKRLLGARP